MRYIFLTIFLLSVIFAQRAFCQHYPYEAATQPWAESLGSQRAVLNIRHPSDIVRLNYRWRRHDNNVAEHKFIIISAETGDTIKNILREKINDEVCHLYFGPVPKAGIYYFYYLPYKVADISGICNGDYLPKEVAPSVEWKEMALKETNPEEALITKIEARNPIDDLFPMEIAATQQEMNTYRKTYSSSMLLFPEDRTRPIKMRKKIPTLWLDYLQGKSFSGTADRGEYYAFQIGLWATQNLEGISYKMSDLKSSSATIKSDKVTCFNVEGTGPYGKPFKKALHVKAGTIQPLWFGIDIDSSKIAGDYRGELTISCKNGESHIIPIQLHVTDKKRPDRGDSETWRYSRLRWLNSTLGIADTPTAPYTPLRRKGLTISCLGRQLTIDSHSSLPKQIATRQSQLLHETMRFIIETDQGPLRLVAHPHFTEETDGHVSYTWEAVQDALKVTCHAVMEFDGWLKYVFTVTPMSNLKVKDIRLEIPVSSATGTYFMGMGLPGQLTPKSYEGKWDAPVMKDTTPEASIPTSDKEQWEWPFDSFWIGNTHVGMHCELRGSSYTGPLLNLYRPAYPESWYNGGKGGFKIKRQGKETLISVYSGPHNLQKDQPTDFEFALLMTPVKPLDTKAQFTNRYYHNGSKPSPTQQDVENGVKVINIHHGNQLHPFLNYPFLTADSIKAFTQYWHQRGCKVKLYYTMRELSAFASELWAMRSLGHEILKGGDRGGFSWLQEHLCDDYSPQWYVHFNFDAPQHIPADAAVLTNESDTRWYNYYVEGLARLIRNTDIDGIYLDDVSFDRSTLKRIRRAMDAVKPGCLIDLHSNTGFSRGPANQYAEFFPYIDKLWFGESFLYDKMTPANWLVESSGIPFGLMGDMLYRGGNKWLGMQYGMTVRYPWTTEGVNCDPRPVWKIWDSFGIADADILGFWEQKPAITTNDEAVKVTAYRKSGKALLSIGNYSDQTKVVKLKVDWRQLGLNPQKISITIPFIDGFQQSRSFNINDTLSVLPRKGWLILLNETY